MIAPDDTGELPLALYDVPSDIASYMTAFPPFHEPTLDYSPELTPPPYDLTAPGWWLPETTSLESRANALFDQYIIIDA